MAYALNFSADLGFLRQMWNDSYSSSDTMCVFLHSLGGSTLLVSAALVLGGRPWSSGNTLLHWIAFAYPFHFGRSGFSIYIQQMGAIISFTIIDSNCAKNNFYCR